MKLTLWALLVLAVLVIGYLGLGLVVAAQLSTPNRQPEVYTPADAGLDYSEVNIQSSTTRSARSTSSGVGSSPAIFDLM